MGVTLGMRKIIVVAAVAAVVLTVAPNAQASTDDYGTVRNILPPGQSGTVNAAGLAQVLAGDPVGRIAVDGRNAPRNFADQLEMYDGFNRLDPAKITQADVDRHYKSAGIEVAPADVARVERPKAGVTITWDRFGVAHVKGTTDVNVAWGAGYAGTRDRMFLQDVLRHAGSARSAEFLGPSPENIAADAEQLRAAYYTPAEAAAQLQHAADNAGDLGPYLLAAGDAYLAGINAAQDKMCPLGLPLGVNCPAEYLALTKVPRRWTRADLTYIGSLVGGIFGKGGGREVANARWLQQLQKQYGDAKGRQVYDDLRSKDDSEASTSISQRFEYGEPTAGIDPTRPGVALPDLAPTATAPGTGSQLGSGLVAGADPLTQARRQPSPGRLRTPFGTIDLRGTLGMSNATLIDADHSASGKPVAVFGPQTGYFTPQLLNEVSLDGPGIKARGVAFAGSGIFVQMGRGLDYAWSATSLGADNVDTVVERLCNPDGSPPTVQSVHYRRGAACVAMTRNEHVETALPTLVAPGAPKILRFLVLRTHHGIVQARTTVDGQPVAVVTQRSTYGRELDSLSGFARFNMPGRVPDAKAFQRAAGKIDFTFNWFYADSRDIALYSSGRLPNRPSTVDVDLPRWGDAAYDWKTWLPYSSHPNAINPPAGFLTNWNNKPAPGFTLGEDNWGDGPVHRQRPLNDRVKAVADTGAATPARLAAAVQDAATVDTRGAHVLPRLLAALGDVSGDPKLAEAVAVLRAWVSRGAHREDRDRDGSYTDQAAIALFDAWWHHPGHAVAKNVLSGRLGNLVNELPQSIDDHPSQAPGSAFANVAWYGYVSKDLRRTFGAPVADPWHQTYCGGGDAAVCQKALRDSLRTTVDWVATTLKVTSVVQFTYDKHRDDIKPTTAGVVGTRPVDWQNRPTFQQVVAFTRHR